MIAFIFLIKKSREGKHLEVLSLVIDNNTTVAGEQVCLQYMFICDLTWKRPFEIRSLVSSLISNVLNCFLQVASCFPEVLKRHIIM